MNTIPNHLKSSDWSFLQALSSECIKAGGCAYLVGGSIRSALLGEKVVDCDVEVFGLDPDSLESILGRIARITRVGKAFGIYKVLDHQIDVGLPRIESKKGTGHRGFEVDIRPDLTLLEAARRRDFTINALYYNLDTLKIEDPLGGMADLESRILRHCSKRFIEDPLRVLRAMQFAARLPADVHPSTIQLCRDLTPENLSAERFFGEWEKLILKGKIPSKGLRFLKDCNWTQYFPSIHAMVGCPQDPRWHPEGDVWEHTLHCMDAYAKYRGGDRDEDLVVGLAVLCHDMGKPRTTEIMAGKIQSHGHEKAGLRPARHFMDQLMVAKRLQEMVLPLILCHMRPAMLFADKSSSNAIRRLARDSGRLDLLMRLFQADASGRPPFPDNSSEAIDWIHQEAENMQVGQSGPAPLIKGRHLLERGWNSGPAMGKFLRMAYELQLDGAFTTDEEAKSWLEDKLS